MSLKLYCKTNLKRKECENTQFSKGKKINITYAKEEK